MIEAGETDVGGKERSRRRSKCDRQNIAGFGKEMLPWLAERGARVHARRFTSIRAHGLGPVI